MNPAPSVIIFTSLSGLGFGLMFFLGFGMPAVTGWVAFAFFFVAYALAVGGLLASTLHLGNPQRAMKAFSQWRTSWLSREGVSAVLTLLVMAVYATGLIFFDKNLQIVGWIAALLSLLTVFTTSKIYNQLKTVPRWHMPLTPVLFLTYALAGGALLSGQDTAAAVLLLVLTALQLAAWQMGDKAFKTAGHTIETATGLGHLGKVRLLEGPHSSPNYLMKEMVHVVGRKHSQKLRVIATITLGLIPAALLLALTFSHLLALIAVISHLIGLFTSRWLFFAEAEHVVGLYYDKR
ncbi:MAG TPA: dibenzothiophene desulfurase [Rhodobacteraceae bacterium]|jgi:sulfite dehydrogenase (quinone) subunit SoeC|nr:dimethyl sulfoxide reductase anchor subunit [Pseudomonadota bacterium]NQW12788.1 dimethyl sulfoxide reductase anchor subunit [Rhodobacter sp.]HBN31393.1 dibenzothiophene desulfurase [Paracoccaceae bacterium]